MIKNYQEKYKARITIAELRKFKKFESLSDEKAEEVIDLMFRLSRICYNYFKKNREI